VNDPESPLARAADDVLPLHAGPERSVAATKTYTAELAAVALLVLSFARRKEELDALAAVPDAMGKALSSEPAARRAAQRLVHAERAVVLARGVHYSTAFEIALKLKELSYIHAEGYAAGELKHGPIALIDETMPVIVVAPSDELFEKTASNLEEASARGGRVILISDRAGIARLGKRVAHTIELPDCDPFVAPILYAVPVQLLAYHAAVAKGTDVDQPRNLAKSVTVE